MLIYFLCVLFLFGACFGSFLCCQARRLHYRTAKTASKPKLKSKSKLKPLSRRSQCLNCHQTLKWYENIPIFAWFFLKGKCRYCHHPIGYAEILSELGVGVAFVLIGTTINPATASCFDWLIFVLALCLTCLLAFLAIYDGLYGELPVPALTFSIICATIILILQTWSFLSVSAFSLQLIWQPLGSIAILGGVYLFLYLISRGKWVGDGDWLLATAIALALASPWLALIALFLANFFACLIMFHWTKKHQTHQISFGPFLVIAFVVTFSFANSLTALI